MPTNQNDVLRQRWARVIAFSIVILMLLWAVWDVFFVKDLCRAGLVVSAPLFIASLAHILWTALIKREPIDGAWLTFCILTGGTAAVSAWMLWSH